MSRMVHPVLVSSVTEMTRPRCFTCAVPTGTAASLEERRVRRATVTPSEQGSEEMEETGGNASHLKKNTNPRTTKKSHSMSDWWSSLYISSNLLLENRIIFHPLLLVGTSVWPCGGMRCMGAIAHFYFGLSSPSFVRCEGGGHIVEM